MSTVTLTIHISTWALAGIVALLAISAAAHVWQVVEMRRWRKL